jgi:hypothetical protein
MTVVTTGASKQDRQQRRKIVGFKKKDKLPRLQISHYLAVANPSELIEKNPNQTKHIINHKS